MRVFQASIEQMLWPERGDKDDAVHATEYQRGRRRLDPADDRGQLIRVPKGYVPEGLRPLLGVGQRLFPMLFRNGEVESGRFPKDTPVSLLHEHGPHRRRPAGGGTTRSSARSCSAAQADQDAS